jgi:hypothetical protein
MDIGEKLASSITLPIFPSFATKRSRFFLAADAVNLHSNGGALIVVAGKERIALTLSMNEFAFPLLTCLETDTSATWIPPGFGFGITSGWDTSLTDNSETWIPPGFCCGITRTGDSSLADTSAT